MHVLSMRKKTARRNFSPATTSAAKTICGITPFLGIPNEVRNLSALQYAEKEGIPRQVARLGVTGLQPTHLTLLLNPTLGFAEALIRFCAAARIRCIMRSRRGEFSMPCLLGA
jgi:hypothetical protein